MDTCVNCKVGRQSQSLSLENLVSMIKYNVGHIIHLQQVKPIHHRYSIEIITGDFMVVTDQTTGHEEKVTLNEFKQKFGVCQWEKLEAIIW